MPHFFIFWRKRYVFICKFVWFFKPDRYDCGYAVVILFYDFVFIVEQTITKPKQINIVFKIPIKQYVSFDTSEEYIDFIKSIINYEPKTKYYSGKVVCVSPFSSLFTKGKVYEIKNGFGKDDSGGKITHSPVKSFEEFSQKLHSRFIELVE